MDDDLVDQLKKEWTKKQVTIDPTAASNRRFTGRVGTVVTVNMNGRALVRFADTLDTCWFDLPIECLIVHDEAADENREPDPLAVPSKDDAATAPELPPQQSDESDRSPPSPPVRRSTMSILEMARRQGAVKKEE